MSPRFCLKMKRKRKKKKTNEPERNGKKRKKKQRIGQMEENEGKLKKTEENKRKTEKTEATPFWRPLVQNLQPLLEITVCRTTRVELFWILRYHFPGGVLTQQAGFPPPQQPSVRYPPYRAIPLRDSIAEGGIAPICLVFMWYRASIAEIPLLGGGGVSHLHFACSPRGKRSEKGEGVSHPIGHVEKPKTP